MVLAKHNSALAVTLGIATLAHLALVVPFLASPKASQGLYTPQLSVTVAAPSDAQRPDQAGFVSIAHQTGGGDNDQLERIKSAQTDRALDSAQTQRHTKGPGEHEDIEHSQGVISVAGDSPRTLGPGTLMLSHSAQDRVQGEAEKPSVAELDLSAEQLMGFGTGSGQSVATVESAKAGYVYRWRQHVQALGTRVDAPGRGLTGQVHLSATLDFKGRLLGYQILSSSGIAELDRRAIAVLQAASPFEPFPNALVAFHDRIQITRIWQFNPSGHTLR